MACGLIYVTTRTRFCDTVLKKIQGNNAGYREEDAKFMVFGYGEWGIGYGEIQHR
jgi:hypothetical protein